MITIFTTSTGAIVKRVASTDGENMTDRSSIADPEGYSETTHRWDATAKQMVSDVSMADRMILGGVDAQRNTALGKMLTAGDPIAYIYIRKAMEVFDYRRILNSILTGLTTDAMKRARFPFAMAEVDLTGESLATVLTRFETGIADSTTELARCEALAQRGKRAVRTANTLSAKQSAASINWNP